MVATKRTPKSNQDAVDATLAADLHDTAGALVVAASKPQLVAQLRSTWRSSTEHATEQALRFLRLFVLSAVPVVADLIVKGSHFDRETLLFALVPVGETVYRQVFPALGAAKVDSAPGVTIVPTQVGAEGSEDVPADDAPEGDAAP